MAADPQRGVDARGSGLYEFWTDRAERVFLHDTHLRVLAYRPAPSPTLSLIFEYNPDWFPTELGERPFVVFTFNDVHIASWRHDDEAHGQAQIHPDAAAEVGQVSTFAWNGEDYFALSSFLLHLEFRAARATVRTATSPDL